MRGLVTKGLCGGYKDCSTPLNVHAKVRDDGGVEFINEGRGARLRIFAALKHRFLKQVPCRSQTSHIPSRQTHSCRRSNEESSWKAPICTHGIRTVLLHVMVLNRQWRDNVPPPPLGDREDHVPFHCMTAWPKRDINKPIRMGLSAPWTAHQGGLAPAFQ